MCAVNLQTNALLFSDKSIDHFCLILCRFTERVLKHGSPNHVALLKKGIVSQLLTLIRSNPKISFDINIEFKTDLETYEAALKQTFGWFTKEAPKVYYILSQICFPLLSKRKLNIFFKNLQRKRCTVSIKIIYTIFQFSIIVEHFACRYVIIPYIGSYLCS